MRNLYATVEATWPPARRFRDGPWTLRSGAGGGKRVCAATAEAPVDDEGIAAMERAQAALGQDALVMLRAGEDALDRLLGARGYRVVDPVVAYAAPAAALAAPAPEVEALWPPTDAQIALWAEGGIGPARIAVMGRAAGPKTALLALHDGHPAGVAFVACDGDTAMIHAVEVAPALRRRGAARRILQAAARWAQDVDATTLSLVVTRQNTAARALYASLGMQVVGQYHYRMK